MKPTSVASVTLHISYEQKQKRGFKINSVYEGKILLFALIVKRQLKYVYQIGVYHA